MKDLTMTKQEEFLAAKAVLDKCIKRINGLAKDAYDEALVCCSEGDLDTRDEYEKVAAYLREAEGKLIHARAAAGAISGGGITRSGGT